MGACHLGCGNKEQVSARPSAQVLSPALDSVVTAQPASGAIPWSLPHTMVPAQGPILHRSPPHCEKTRLRAPPDTGANFRSLFTFRSLFCF